MTRRFVGTSLVVACTRAFATSRNHLATAALAVCLSGFNPTCRMEATNGTQLRRRRLHPIADPTAVPPPSVIRRRCR
jgi:hypothetical protein